MWFQGCRLRPREKTFFGKNHEKRAKTYGEKWIGETK
jgi:hypothetical protein